MGVKCLKLRYLAWHGCEADNMTSSGGDARVARNILRAACILAMGLLAWGSRVGLAQAAGGLSEEDRRDLLAINPGEHIKRLAAIQSRFTGYPGCKEAEAYILSRYEELGLANVSSKPFQIIVPVDQGASLRVGDQEIVVHCVRPNYVRTPKTTESGITGDLIWGGQGYSKDFEGREVMGNIVLMEFNSATRWLNAAALGADAIIFIEPLHAFRPDAEQKYVTSPVPTPRYYLEREYLPALAAAVSAVAGGQDVGGGVGAAPAAGTQPPPRLDEDGALALLRDLGLGRKASATIRAEMTWEEQTGDMVSGEIPGTDLEMAEQVVVCHAFYDSTSVVPALSPGAESACGIAAQLEIAEYLLKHPPRRTVKLLATPGHFQALAGAREYAFRTIYPRRAEVAKDEEERRGGEPFFFIGLDLSSRHDTMAAFYKGNFYDQYGKESEINLQRVFSECSSLILSWADEVIGPRGVVGAMLAEERRGGGREAGLTSGAEPSDLAYSAEASSAAKAGSRPSLVNPPPPIEFQSGIVPQHGRGWRSLLPDLAAFDAEAITLSGRPALTLATTGDPRNSVNTPLDTYENLEPYLENVRSQAIVSAHIVKRLVDLPRIPLLGEVGGSEKAGTIFGRAIEQTLSDYVPTVNVPDVVAAVDMATAKSMMGVRCRAFARSDAQGLFEMIGLKAAEQYVVDGFLISPSSGAIDGVATGTSPDSRALVLASSRERQEWELRDTDVRLNLFDCVSTSVFDLMDPLRQRMLGSAQVLRGESNSNMQYAISFVGGGIAGTSYNEPVACFFTPPGSRLKLLFAGGLAGNDAILLNLPGPSAYSAEAAASAAKAGQPSAPGAQATDEAPKPAASPTGLGFLAEKAENFIYLTAYQMAKDMYRLDADRLETLKATAIFKKNVWDLHAQAGVYLAAAERALRAKHYDRFECETGLALGLEGRVYPDVRGTAHDVVRGVIFYFALLLPFVIFAERLLINYVDIRKKLTAIGAIFVFSYLLLRLVHPAFRLSKAPIIILDGFFMVVASLWTVWYLILKFQTVMEHLKRRVLTIHRADVARASAAMAAFVLGISNMRKRKVRTLLTAFTLILLTFTILSFTSFETMPARMLRIKTSVKAPYTGLLVRGLNWAPMSEFQVYDLENFFQVEGLISAPRSWLVNRDPTQELRLDIKRVTENSTEATGNEVRTLSSPSPRMVASAMLGLSPQEDSLSGVATKYLAHGVWFDPAAPDWPFVCILPTGMMENLRLEPEDIGTAQILVLGRRLRVVGSLNTRTKAGEKRFFEFEDLDEEPLTPVDFVEQQYKMAAGAEGEGPSLTATGETDVEAFLAQKGKQKGESLYIHMDPDRVLIVPNELCLKLGGTLRSIAAGPAEAHAPILSAGVTVGRSFEQSLRLFGSRVNMALYAGVEGFVHRVATRSSLSMSGLQGLVVPILIAALIVFNTMLGAVYERVGEIKVYASVGLAPIHIAALFFAESCVFAVVGAMVGYLLGQFVSFVLMRVPWLMEGISLNYSSVSAVWSALLVIVVVLASTAYPAHMAGKLSVPDETRKMVLPKPASDVWDIRFPFTVSSKEALGVMAYLREYFQSNDEDSTGAFTAHNTRMFRGDSAQAPGIQEHGGESAEAPAEIAAGQEPGTLHPIIVLNSDVWVAPLDMGISQSVSIASVPDSEEPEITYLFFRIARKSGEFATWHRMNLGFLRDLRKQLLIWRLVTSDEKERLAREGAALLGGQDAGDA